MVRPAQRVVGNEVQMVGQEHEGARRHGRVEAAGGVSDDHHLGPQLREHPHWQGYLPGGVAFVVVLPSLQHGDAPAAEQAKEQVAGMARHRGGREVWNRGKGQAVQKLQAVGHPAQTGAQGEDNLGREINLLAEKGRGLFNRQHMPREITVHGSPPAKPFLDQRPGADKNSPWCRCRPRWQTQWCRRGRPRSARRTAAPAQCPGPG